MRDDPTVSRRRFLLGSAAVAALLAAPSCAYMTPKAQQATTKPVEPKIDGDLVYFNWADYVDPSCVRRLPERIRRQGHPVELRLDGEHAGQARRRQPVRHHLPVGAVGAEAGRRQPVTHDRPVDTEERPADLRPLRVLRRSLVRPAKSAHSIPFSMYKTGIAWRKDKLGETLTGGWSDLWNETSKGRTFVLDDRDEVLGMLSLLLGYDLNTAGDRELGEIVDRFRSLRPYLRGFSSDDYNNLLSGDAWMHQTWSGDMAALLWQARGRVDLRIRGADAGHPDQLRHLRDPDQRAPPGHRAAVHRLHAAARKRREEHQLHRLPDAGARHRGRLSGDRGRIIRSARSRSRTWPATSISRNDSVAKTQARDAAYTEMKVGL